MEETDKAEGQTPKEKFEAVPVNALLTRDQVGERIREISRAGVGALLSGVLSLRQEIDFFMAKRLELGDEVVPIYVELCAGEAAAKRLADRGTRPEDVPGIEIWPGGGTWPEDVPGIEIRPGGEPKPDGPVEGA